MLTYLLIMWLYVGGVFLFIKSAKPVRDRLRERRPISHGLAIVIAAWPLIVASYAVHNVLFVLNARYRLCWTEIEEEQRRKAKAQKERANADKKTAG